MQHKRSNGIIRLDELFSVSQVFKLIPQAHLTIPRVCVTRLLSMVSREKHTYGFRYTFLNGHPHSQVLFFSLTLPYVAAPSTHIKIVWTVSSGS